MNQDELMKFDPATGEDRPYPSHAQQWRKYRGPMAWLFNPWTGARRRAEDVGSDTYGQLMVSPEWRQVAMRYKNEIDVGNK